MARRLHAARTAAAVLLALTAVNHARLAATGQGVVWRHALFAGIDLAAAALLVLWPRRALAPIALLAAQQMYSHGRDLVASIEAARAAGSSAGFDWASLGVVLFFPAVVTLLVVERRSRGRSARR